jgi:hypothetical protein
MQKRKRALALVGFAAMLAGPSCDLAEEECGACDGERQGEGLCVVALESLPAASGGRLDAGSPRDAGLLDAAEAGAAPAETSGPASESGERWQSAPWQDAEWLSLPGRTKLKLEHGLGRVPDLVQVYLSFEKDDSDRAGTRSSFLAAGDLAHITEVTVSSITIENTTEQSFCLRVVLE